MTFYFSHGAFTLEDILRGKINQKNLTESERYVLNFVQEWFTEKSLFEFNTSGSTGIPKKILLSKDQLAYSASETMKFLFPNRPKNRLVLCLDPHMIGGTQLITRALVSKMDLQVISPSSNPISALKNPADLISMVPMQVKYAMQQPENFHLLSKVLIGGGDLDSQTVSELRSVSSTVFYQSYGMTETASHIALREIGKSHYELLGDIKIEVDERDCLKCCGTVTNHEWIQTNDIVELSDSGFVWKGRADWVINTGGIKIHPEMVEDKIINSFPDISCIITSLTDQKLGEKVVLVSDTPVLNRLKSLNILSRYEMPKEEFILNDFPLLSNQKIDRLDIREWVLQNSSSHR